MVERLFRRRGATAITVSKLGALVVVALACGLGAKAADESSRQWASDLGTYPGAWIFVGLLIGRFASSSAAAILGAALFFLATVVSYYTYSEAVLGFGGGHFVYIWTGVALVLAPPGAAVVSLSYRRRGWAAALVASLVAGAILADGPLRQYWNELTIDLPSDFPFHPVQAVIDVVLAAASVLLLTGDWRGRILAVALLFPAMLLAERATEHFWSIIYR